MLGVSSIVPNKNIDGNDLHGLSEINKISTRWPDGEKIDDSSASFDVRPDLFVW